MQLMVFFIRHPR